MRAAAAMTGKRGMGKTGFEKTGLGEKATGRDVSFVIVSYWTGPLLARAVKSCLAQEATREVILVDNGNWPDFAEKLHAEIGAAMKRVEIVTGHGNIGFARACNLGARKASGAYLFFLNPDAELAGDTLAILLGEASGLKRPWMMGGRLLNRDGSEQAGARRQSLTPGTAFIEMTRAYKLVPNHPYFRRFNDHEQACPDRITAQPVISGACMFLPKASYDAIGGMDEGYFLHLEDVDFCLRFARAGGQIFFVPQATVLHAKTASRVNVIRVERHKATSMCRYFLTHFRRIYPAVFLWLICMMVWARFCLWSGLTYCRAVMRLLLRRGRPVLTRLRRSRRISDMRRQR